ncbi:MAG: hypothetical protein CVV64_17400 [Candidatus Wallbacteria bacterium HGW-Wallbacteria-1]|jgi:predicted nucleic acid-binding protein|uniref:Uncharacterized protein n=1 Tax=Candidatus Wallbacteria bacterium HGW-Wallbacteria-1 TaxID=2013854 RepID=A0A2N1PKB8_9BACT|nr:MAG: hypothetical protein CVV64_17400 [Candidatus Wallbacteria bacterium HGW-Wallbacteria-1]
MEWLNSCLGKTIGLDTAPMIYFIEENSKYFDIVKPFFEAIDAGKIRVVTSTVTLLEVSTALNAGASFFLTNDIRLPDIQGMKILCLDGLNKA